MSDIDGPSSIRSLHQPISIRSTGDLGKAPIFYDMYDPPPSEFDHQPDHSHPSNQPDLPIEQLDDDLGDITDATDELDVTEQPAPLTDSHAAKLRQLVPTPTFRTHRHTSSLRKTRLIHKRILALDAVRPKRASTITNLSNAALDRPPSKSMHLPPRQPETDHDLTDADNRNSVPDYESDVTPTTEPQSHRETEPPETAQFSRRVKTLLSEPVAAKKRQPVSVPRPYRKIEESPYSDASQLSQKVTCGTGETKIYHAYTDALQREARGRAGGLRIIVDLLRDSDGNPIVIEKAALAIGILSENDSATRDVLGQHSAVQSLIQCLSMRLPAKHDKSKIVSSVIFAIACLLKESPRNVRLFETFDGPQKMGKAAASERYENCPAVPKHALKALSELKHHPSHTSESFTTVLSSSSSANRTIRYVLRSMALHEHRMDIQEYGLDALRTLLARAGKGGLSNEVMKLSAQATATAFKMHSESKEIQWQCLTLLCDLDDMREGLFSLDLDVESFFGALRLVSADAKTNGARKPKLGKSLVSLIRRSVDVAVNYGWRNQEFKNHAVEAGAVETVLDVLDAYGHDPQIVDKICTILRVLLQSDEGRYRMNSSGSACAILSGIETVTSRAAGMLPS